MIFLQARDIARISKRLRSMIIVMDDQLDAELADRAQVPHPDNETDEQAYTFYQHLKEMGW